MRLAITLLLAFTAAAAAQDNPALPVIKSAVEAHGGAEALAKARTARQSASGTLIAQGKESKFSYTAAYAIPEKYRVEMTADIGGLVTGTTALVLEHEGGDLDERALLHVLNGAKERSGHVLLTAREAPAR